MKVENGKIVEATELELYDYYLTREWYYFYSFTEYKYECELNGTKITDKEEE